MPNKVQITFTDAAGFMSVVLIALDSLPPIFVKTFWSDVPLTLPPEMTITTGPKGAFLITAPVDITSTTNSQATLDGQLVNALYFYRNAKDEPKALAVGYNTSLPEEPNRQSGIRPMAEIIAANIPKGFTNGKISFGIVNA